MTFSHPIYLVLLTPLMLLTCCSTSAPLPPNTSEVSYLATDRRPFLKTGKNGEGRLLWLIDSGATQSFLFTDGSRLPDSVTLGKKTRSTQIHGLTTMRKISSSRFRIVGQNHPPITGYTHGKKESLRPIRFHGVIGLNTLKKEHAVLSIAQKQLAWQQHHSAANTSAGIRLQTHPASGHLILDGLIDGHAVRLIVDTGAARSMISFRTATKLGLKLRSSRKSISGVYHKVVAMGRTKNVKLSIPSSGNTYSTEFTVTDLTNITNAKRLKDIDGLIGYDFLQSHFSAIDFGHGQLKY